MIFTALIITHTIIAMSVSVHILFTKRDSRAAISWLGVVWLSPLVGSLVYGIFGINRVARRALKLRLTNLSLPQDLKTIPTQSNTPYDSCTKTRMHLVGDAVSNQHVVAGNHLDIFQNGDEAYPEMITAIESAKKTIALSSYIFRLDENGHAFVDALKQARLRGVVVKVLVDGVGGGLFNCPATVRLNEAGIDAHRFFSNLKPWRMLYLNLRNHKKLLIIDGKKGFVGGLNLGNENLLRKKHLQKVRDTHFCFTGPVVAQLLESFAEDWHFVTNEELNGLDWWPLQESAGQVEARVVDSGPDHDLGSIEKLLSAAINGAKHHIRIVTPYFLPDERIKFLLGMAVLRGVKVEIVIPKHTDFKLFDWAMEGQLSFMDMDRIVFRRSALPFDHSKLITIDGKWCAVGSPNWDVRSMRLNFEILVECYDRETVKRIDKIIDQKMEQATAHQRVKTTWKTLFLRLRNSTARLLMPYL